MKYALSLTVLAAPSLALAHNGAHMHPHGSEGWLVGLAMISLATVMGVAKARKAKAKVKA